MTLQLLVNFCFIIAVSQERTTGQISSYAHVIAVTQPVPTDQVNAQLGKVDQGTRQPASYRVSSWKFHRPKVSPSLPIEKAYAFPFGSSKTWSLNLIPESLLRGCPLADGRGGKWLFESQRVPATV